MGKLRVFCQVKAFAVDHGFELCVPWEVPAVTPTPAWAGRPPEDFARINTVRNTPRVRHHS